MFDRLVQKEETWLEGEICVKELAKRNSSSGGRPSKPWDELGERSKQLKVSNLSQNHLETLSRAAFLAQKRQAESVSTDTEIITVKRKSLFFAVLGVNYWFCYLLRLFH